MALYKSDINTILSGKFLISSVSVKLAYFLGGITYWLLSVS